MRIHFAVGGPVVPSGARVSLGDVPSDLVLRAAAPSQRARLLVGLALSLHDRGEGAFRAALWRVAEECTGLALTDALEVLGRQRSLGFVVEALGLEWLLALGARRGVALNDVLANSDTVARRGLTRFEQRKVKELFGLTLDPATVRFHFTTGVETLGSSGLALGNTIHVDPTAPYWHLAPGTTRGEREDDDAWGSFNGVLLAHEPTHVWSYQHLGSRYAVDSVQDQLRAMQTGDRGGAYFYTPGKPHFLDYGEEQRAMLVQDFAAAWRAQRRGRPTAFTLGLGERPVQEALDTLGPYLEQLRAMGPGLPEPEGRTPQWVVCACSRLPVQDGAAGALGAQSSALVAAAGRAATDALSRGVQTRDAGLIAAGSAGVAAALAASVIPREQSANGATSGGSAVLDQAGIPRGVELTEGDAQASVKLAWDAPSPAQGPGLHDPRVEWRAGGVVPIGPAELTARGAAVVATAGDVRRAEGSVALAVDEVSVAVSGGLQPERAHTEGQAWSRLELVTEPLRVEAGARGTVQGGVTRALSVDAAVETKGLELAAQTSFSRPSGDAPFALERAEATVHATVRAGVTAGVEVGVVPQGVDRLAAEVAAQGDAGSLSVRVEGDALQSAPRASVAVTATEASTGVSVSAKGSTQPSSGAVEGQVLVTVPLP